MTEIYKTMAEWLAQAGGIALLMSAATALIRFICSAATGKEKLL